MRPRDCAMAIDPSGSRLKDDVGTVSDWPTVIAAAPEVLSTWNILAMT